MSTFLRTDQGVLNFTPETMGVLNFPVLNFPLCRKLWVSLIFLNFPSYGCP